MSYKGEKASPIIRSTIHLQMNDRVTTSMRTLVDETKDYSVRMCLCHSSYLESLLV